jgi:hypothetical protein
MINIFIVILRWIGRSLNNSKIKVLENRNNELPKEKTFDEAIEELYPNMTEDEIWEAILAKDENELTIDELCIKFGGTFIEEQSRALKIIVNDLIENKYDMSSDTENHYKEPINRTLKYFDKKFKENPFETEIELRNSFPVMQKYILNHILKQNIITDNENVDELLAYNEFHVFVFENRVKRI